MAAKSIEAVINSGHVTGANQAKMVLALGQIYYRQGDYPKAVVWLTRYQSESGDNSNHNLLVDSYFRSGKIAEAFKETKADIQAEEKAGRAPSEQQLSTLVSCENKLGDKAGYLAALEKGLTPDTVREDAPISVHGWNPENYSREYFGPVTLTRGLSLSLNTVRRELAYLRDLGLVELEGENAETWFAKLTSNGVDVVEYNFPSPAGVARPRKYW